MLYPPVSRASESGFQVMSTGLDFGVFNPTCEDLDSRRFPTITWFSDNLTIKKLGGIYKGKGERNQIS